MTEKKRRRSGRHLGRKQTSVELRSAVTGCLEQGEPRHVNMSIPRHEVLTSVLREFVYESRFSNRELPIVFADGSRPPAFPVGCLEEDAALESEERPVLARLGLMTFRHPEIDFLVDLYVTRNIELSRDSAISDEEETAYQRTIELLTESKSLQEKQGELWVYHTGLEPMVVGFYRAVVEVLRRRRAAGKRGSLLIRPWVLDTSPGDRNQRLTPASPGARHESYKSLHPWY